MAEFRRKVGTTLGLKLLLKPADDSLFVRAFLTDKAGVALSPASVDLANVGGGQYVENTQLMQATDQMVASYRVFDDSGFTLLNGEFPGDTDYFDKETPSSAPSSGGSQLIGVLRGPGLTGILKPC